MTSKFLSLVAGVAALGLVGAAANAAEPMQLSELQMDSVTAGSLKKGIHKQVFLIKVAADIDLRKDDLAKAKADAYAEAPAKYNVFTYTQTDAQVYRDKKIVAGYSASESVAAIDGGYVKK
jgi:hypothetical protein